MESGRKSPESMGFPSGNVLPPDSDVEKENLAVEDGKKNEINKGFAVNNIEYEENGMKDTEVLDDKTIKKIQEFSYDFFESVESGKINRDMDMSEATMIESYLNHIIGNKKDWEEKRLCTPKLREATKVFLDELLDFSEEHKNDDNFEDFSAAISEFLFSATPSIVSHLNLSDHFDFIAKATRMPEIQRSFGGKVSGEFLYDMNFGYDPEEFKDILIENFNDSPLPEKFDKLNLIENLAAEAIGQSGAFSTAEEKIKYFISNLEKENDSYFVGCYINILKDRIGREKENPTKSIVQYSRDPSNSRLRDLLAKEEIEKSEKLERMIYPVHGLNSEEKIVKVGEDMVAVFDHSNTPVRFAKMDVSSLKENDLLISGKNLAAIEKILDMERNEINIDNFILFINQNLIEPYNKIQNGDYSELADKWSRYSENISKEEWEEYFMLKSNIKNAKQKISKYEMDRYHETGDMNFKETMKFYEYFQENAKNILGQSEYADNDNLIQNYEEFVKFYKEKDYEQAFAAMDNFMFALTFNPYELFSKQENKKKNDALSDLVFRYENLHHVHARNNEQSGRYTNKYNQEQYKKYEDDIFRLGNLRSKVFSNAENIFQNFKSDFSEMKDELKKEMKSVDFKSYDEMSKDYNLGSLRHADSKDMGLLLQHLHRPKMKNYIEKELDIELEEIPFIYQIYLLEFLSDKSKEEVDEVKEFLDQGESDDAKNNRIKSFLSLESGQEMGERILNIGEKLDTGSADAIFAKYTEIINLTDKTREELEELFKDRKNVTNEEREKITDALLNKARQILIDFSVEINKDEKIDKDNVLKKLDVYKADMILSASVYKSIDKNEEVSFEDLKGVLFEQRKAGNFSNSEIDEMLMIYAENYKDKPKLQAKLVENFKNILENKDANTQIYFYKKDDKIVAFNRFDQKEGEEGKKYFGSYNVDPRIRGFEIGASLLKASLDKEAKNNIIEADCDSSAIISTRYVGPKCEFVIKKIIPNYGDSGETIFHIERKETNKKYYYHGYKDKDIIDEYENNAETEADKEKFIMKFQAGSKELFDKSKELVNQKGYIISNYLFGKDNQVYCAFEKEM